MKNNVVFNYCLPRNNAEWVAKTFSINTLSSMLSRKVRCLMTDAFGGHRVPIFWIHCQKLFWNGWRFSNDTQSPLSNAANIPPERSSLKLLKASSRRSGRVEVHLLKSIRSLRTLKFFCEYDLHKSKEGNIPVWGRVTWGLVSLLCICAY